VLSARATRGLELALFVVLVSPLLAEWYETTSASSRLSYALLVPALSLVLALRARGSSMAGATSPGAAGAGSSPRAAAAWAALAALALVGGTLSGVFTLSLLAVPLAACAFAARWAGPRGLRPFVPALALAFLLVPPPMPLMDRVNPFLVEASGQTAVHLLRPLDAQASWLGSTLSYRGWTLIVAEVCSGSGTFLMLGTLCAFLAGLFRLRAPFALGLVLLSLPVTLLVNGVRIASSALVIDRFGVEAGQGLAHELLGQFVVVAGAALLVLCVERGSLRLAPARTA
jgi:exosortase/archaeosortase family protein